MVNGHVNQMVRGYLTVQGMIMACVGLPLDRGESFARRGARWKHMEDGVRS